MSLFWAVMCLASIPDFSVEEERMDIGKQQSLPQRHETVGFFFLIEIKLRIFIPRFQRFEQN